MTNDMRSIIAIIAHPFIYMRGISEAHGDIGITYGTPDSLRSIAYDIGREHALSADKCECCG